MTGIILGSNISIDSFTRVNWNLVIYSNSAVEALHNLSLNLCVFLLKYAIRLRIMIVTQSKHRGATGGRPGAPRGCSWLRCCWPNKVNVDFNIDLYLTLIRMWLNYYLLSFLGWDILSEAWSEILKTRLVLFFPSRFVLLVDELHAIPQANGVIPSGGTSVASPDHACVLCNCYDARINCGVVYRES